MKEAGTEIEINGIENLQGIRSCFQYLRVFPNTTIMLHESAIIGISLIS